MQVCKLPCEMRRAVETLRWRETATGEQHWQIVYTGMMRGKLFMIPRPLF
jgi:hypothetical protein